MVTAGFVCQREEEKRDKEGWRGTSGFCVVASD